MGKTYGVPRSAKGESRILYIFTVKSLLGTVVALGIGAIPWWLLSQIGLKTPGLIIMLIFAALGYGIMTLKIPDAPAMGKLRKAGGEQVFDILFRTLTFSRRRKVYVYRKGGNKQWDKTH